MTLAPGTRLGPYEIVAPIGAGAMGEDYKARDTRLDRDVAVKILAAGTSLSPEARERFTREARTISQVSHPVGRLRPAVDRTPAGHRPRATRRNRR